MTKCGGLRKDEQAEVGHGLLRCCRRPLEDQRRASECHERGSQCHECGLTRHSHWQLTCANIARSVRMRRGLAGRRIASQSRAWRRTSHRHYDAGGERRTGGSFNSKSDALSYYRDGI